MLISIHDKSLHRVAFLDNDKNDTLHYFNDLWTRYLAEATSTFDFSVPKAEKKSDLQFLSEKNYISFREDGKDYLFNIMKLEDTEDRFIIYTENLNLELLNEQSPPYTAASAMTFKEYFNDATLVGGASFSDLEIGNNEISEYKRKLSWEGTDTKLARLLSLVKQFDAECEFVTSLNRDGTLNKITINLYKEHSDTNQGVGARRSDVTLYYGKEITDIRRKIDKTELYTAIQPTGTDGLKITSIEETVTDSSGNTLYYTKSGDPNIYAPQSADAYPAHINSTGDQWTLLRWDYDTDTASTLYSKALAKLKSVCLPSITYEIEGTKSLNIGDTVTIYDEKFTPPLMLEARVSKQEISFTDPKQNKNTYSNFRALESEVSDSISNRLEAIVTASIPYTAEMLADNGLTFKNSEGSTTLTARVLKGSKTVTSELTIKWYKDGAEISTGQSLTVKASDVSGRSVYRYDGILNNSVICSSQVTIIDISDGTDGQDAILLRIDSSRGTVFKNNSISTVLTVAIYYGSQRITDINTLHSAFGSGAYLEWKWQKINDSSFGIISSTDARITDSGFTLTLTPSDVDTKCVFMCTLNV